MKNHNHDIVVIGDLVVDTFLVVDHQEAELHCQKRDNCSICFAYGRKIPVQAYFQSPGGNATNVALSLRKLGLNPVIVSTIGRDRDSKLVTDMLESNHLNIDYLERRADLKISRSTVIVYDGERTILVYHQPSSHQYKRIPESEWIYLTSIGPGPTDIYRKILHQREENSSKLIFQPGTFQLRLDQELLARLLMESEILLVNLEEARVIVDRFDSRKESKDDDIKSVLGRLLACGPKQVVVTNGKRGAFYSDGVTSLMIEAWLTEKVVDPTGAGDSFAAGFVGAILLDRDVASAMQWGIINSHFVVLSIGAHSGLLSQTEIRHYLRDSNVPTARIF